MSSNDMDKAWLFKSLTELRKVVIEDLGVIKVSLRCGTNAFLFGWDADLGMVSFEV